MAEVIRKTTQQKTVVRGPRRTRAQLKQYEDLDQAIRDYAEARRVATEAEENKQAAGQAILTAMDGLGLDNYENADAKVAVTSRSSSVVSPDKLKKRVGAQMWRKITTSVLDTKKLDSEVRAGNIPASVVAACTDTTSGKPYPKVTNK